MPKQVCSHCGATMVKYRHSLNQALVDGLRSLNTAGGMANLASLGFTRNQWDNFQKLRYWNLVEKTITNGKRVKGSWSITPTGKGFLQGLVKVKKTVLTYRGTPVKYLGRQVNIKSLFSTRYKQRPQYASDAVI